ncbi:GNAT family N-acetyltransferase [Formosa algae]|uniref:GNAT family N-acetyltransferase n=1 Tax=Formosa algae TaxID=225843 RepID=UPI000CCE89B8|nr:GNAT family N-acetyltransferase [Formosa algae]PNW27231.1 hypothetical protein BKP44_14160 [Formosa algae]
MNYETKFKPSKIHLSQIEKWLIEELNETEIGFYNNWNRISKAFLNNNLIVITENDFAIGFLVYKTYEVIIEIDITELKPNYRNKGFGRKLIEDTLSEFKKNGMMICELFCSPKNSEPIWKSLGFENFPDFGYDSKIRMFKTLVPTLKTSELNERNERIELWNMEPHLAERNNPEWTWNLNFKDNSRELIKPIIYPANYNWQLSWKTGTETKFKNQIKRYNSDRIEFGNFIVIKALPN